MASVPKAGLETTTSIPAPLTTPGYISFNPQFKQQCLSQLYDLYIAKTQSTENNYLLKPITSSHPSGS